MFFSIGVISGILIALVAYVGTFFRVKIRHQIDLVDWFAFSLGTINGLGFAFVVWATNAGINDRWANYIVLYRDLVWVYAPCTLILLISIWVGSSVIRHYHQKNAIKCESFSRSTYSKILILAWIFLLIGVGSHWLYTLPYGGFAGHLKLSYLIRAGLFQFINVVNPWSFLKPFASLSFFASFLFWGVLWAGGVSGFRKLLTFVGFFLSFAWSVFVLVSWMGRSDLTVYLITFPTSYLLLRYGLSFRMIKRFVLIILIALIFFPLTTSILERQGGDREFMDFYSQELSFPFASFFLNLEEGHCRFFKEVAVFSVYLLPQRIYKGLLGLETVSDVNTEMIQGAEKGNLGVTAEIPVDFLTFAIMQGYIPGIVVLGFLWGILLVKIDTWVKWLYPPGIRETIYASLIFQLAGLTALYGDPRHIIWRNFSVIVGSAIVLLVLSGHLRKRRQVYAK